MNIFVLEIDLHPAALFNARSLDDAREVAEATDVRDFLHQWGVPRKDQKLGTVRPATDAERLLWEGSYSRAETDGRATREKPIWVIALAGQAF
jgi:hypothetical protein